MSLSQTGIVKNLPDPPGPFDSARVDASEYAYKRLMTPDALMMVVSDGATARLAAAGGKDRAAALPLPPLAMGLKIVGDAATALELGREEWQQNKALGASCQVARPWPRSRLSRWPSPGPAGRCKACSGAERPAPDPVGWSVLTLAR
ncbi:hypothetical protein [Deinococcus aestuarii]|uniref:hypothetical protein n=1 Tax=Deinococcus aestuarii TaxID=2774531 RepID=UPI001C0C657A|nr:hypothetical protein [Deinococcus aestuarii]